MRRVPRMQRLHLYDLVGPTGTRRADYRDTLQFQGDEPFPATAAAFRSSDVWTITCSRKLRGEKLSCESHY